MATLLDKFNRQVSLLMNSGAMADKCWPAERVKHETQHYLKLWKKMQNGIQYTMSPITYVQLKDDARGNRREVLEAAKQGDINMFMVIKSGKDHHAIVDECGEIK